MSTEVLLSLISVGIVLLVAFPVHEFSHALAAYRLGDSTARYQGRLTLNPVVHFDPLGGTLLALSAFLGGIFIGWAKPTPVNPYNLRYGRRGEALVALAGPLSNLVMAALVAIPIRLIASDPGLALSIRTSTIATAAYDVAWFFVAINCFLFLFNLLPVPPLDGWKVLVGLVDARTSYSLRQFEQYGFLLLIGIVLLGGRVIAPVGLFIIDFLTGGARPFPM